MQRIFIWFLMIFGGTALSLYLDAQLFSDYNLILPFYGISAIIGLLLFYAVIRISKNTGRTLAKYGRKGELKRMETNFLVNQGVYKYMRHPMHLGLLLFPLSIAFLMGSPSFVLLIAPSEIIFMLLMIKFVEEPEVIRKFGDQYLEYKEGVPWFCIKIRCLKELLTSVPKN